MNDRTNENLEELLAKHFGAEQAGRIARDIKDGEKILEANPAAEPANLVKANIKADLATRLAERKTKNLWSVLYKAAAIAAVFIIAAFVGVKLLTPEEPDVSAGKTISRVIWESSDITADDPELATLVAEIEDAENNITAVRLDEYDNGNGIVITELEMELIEIESDFWKG